MTRPTMYCEGAPLKERTAADIASITAILAKGSTTAREIRNELGLKKGRVASRLTCMRRMGLAYSVPVLQDGDYQRYSWQLGVDPDPTAANERQDKCKGAEPRRPIVKAWAPCLRCDPLVAALFGMAGPAQEQRA